MDFYVIQNTIQKSFSILSVMKGQYVSTEGPVWKVVAGPFSTWDEAEDAMKEKAG